MGKMLMEARARAMRPLSWLALIGLLLLLVGCTVAGNSPDNDKNNGFYGGLNGGGSRP